MKTMKKNTNTKTTTTTKKGVTMKKNTKNTNTTKKERKTMKNTKTVTPKVIRLTKIGNPSIELTQYDKGEMVDVVISGITFHMDVDSANELYLDRLENGYKVAEEKKASAPKEPKVEKTVEDKKAEREQKLTEKYGDIDVRRAYVQKRNAIWAEESAKIAEEVKSGARKRMGKDAWKKLMNERVNARLASEQ